MPGVLFIKAGTLDDTSWLNPELEFFCNSAQAWVGSDEQRRKLPGNLPFD